MTDIDIYNFINSPDVADYCREIGKVWTPFEMAVIIGRNTRHSMEEKHEAWRELIADYPDMPTPATPGYPRFESLHQKLAEVISYEERALALFLSPEAGTFYTNDTKGYDPFDDADTFPDYESAISELMDDLKYMRDLHRIQRILMKKIYIGSEHRIDCYFDLDGNVLCLFVACYDERFPDIDFEAFMDLSPGFNNEEAYYVDIPVPFQRGDLLQCKRYAWEYDEPFVLERLADRERLYKMVNGMTDSHGADDDWDERSKDSAYGLRYSVNRNGKLCAEVEYENDCLVYYQGELNGPQRLLKYISLCMQGEMNLYSLDNDLSKAIGESLERDDILNDDEWNKRLKDDSKDL